ncbi:MAG TPA: diguanylate cyclase [Deltaproteobacteria bacterium]|nr:diguanylate cyclase [Deltaproteobacteria bacterium]
MPIIVFMRKDSPLAYSASLAWRYLGIICLVISLVVIFVFWYFIDRVNTLIEDQLVAQGRAAFQEVVIMREWVAQHGGVYVKLKAGDEINPYLKLIPGLKVVVRDINGEIYTLKNPSLVTRELSELTEEKGMLSFKITSLKPLNPNNVPDAFERKALQAFEKGAKENYSIETRGRENVFRYIAPLITEQSCLRCHARQGYKPGDIRGAIGVSIPATFILEKMHRNSIFLIIATIGIIVLTILIILSVAAFFIPKLKAVQARLFEMATTDHLTGFLNRRELFNRLEGEFARCDRHKNIKALSIIMIDIDHFKQVNDTYGHSAGDLVLKFLATILRSCLRDYDMPCRYGGEEFFIISPETDANQAMKLAERLRCKVEAAEIRLEDKSLLRITISLGVSQYHAGENIDELLSRADTALYQAKTNGRNQVILL